MGFETDSNGLVAHYGPMVTPPGSAASGGQSLLGDESALVFDFNYNDLPAGSTTNKQIPTIPQNALILSARAEVLVAFAGGTSLTVGLVRATDGTTSISSNGLMSATDLASANLTPAGNPIVGTGSLIGAVSSNTYASQVVVAANGTFTAGRLRVVVRYMQPTLTSSV